MRDTYAKLRQSGARLAWELVTKLCFFMQFVCRDGLFSSISAGRFSFQLHMPRCLCGDPAEEQTAGPGLSSSSTFPCRILHSTSTWPFVTN